MTPTMTPIRVVLLAKPSKVVYICFTLLQLTVESRYLSFKLRQKKLLLQAEEIDKTTIVFTQNGPR